MCGGDLRKSRGSVLGAGNERVVSGEENARSECKYKSPNTECSEALESTHAGQSESGDEISRGYTTLPRAVTPTQIVVSTAAAGLTTSTSLSTSTSLTTSTKLDSYSNGKMTGSVTSHVDVATLPPKRVSNHRPIPSHHTPPVTTKFKNPGNNNVLLAIDGNLSLSAGLSPHACRRRSRQSTKRPASDPSVTKPLKGSSSSDSHPALKKRDAMAHGYFRQTAIPISSKEIPSGRSATDTEKFDLTPIMFITLDTHYIESNLKHMNDTICCVVCCVRNAGVESLYSKISRLGFVALKSPTPPRATGK
ncbi:hypothetical protein C8Q75DRAFT_863140 [Abortiporus biennis]|nr:hypothetical protein C8Q75DRAFT_863140 [Abortiporus biennis]